MFERGQPAWFSTIAEHQPTSLSRPVQDADGWSCPRCGRAGFRSAAAVVGHWRYCTVERPAAPRESVPARPLAGVLGPPLVRAATTGDMAMLAALDARLSRIETAVLNHVDHLQRVNAGLAGQGAGPSWWSRNWQWVLAGVGLLLLAGQSGSQLGGLAASAGVGAKLLSSAATAKRSLRLLAA